LDFVGHCILGVTSQFLSIFGLEGINDIGSSVGLSIAKEFVDEPLGVFRGYIGYNPDSFGLKVANEWWEV